MRAVVVGGEWITVEILDDEDEPELETRDAVFLPSEARIVIDGSFDQSFRWHLLGHEILHAVCRHVGFRRVLTKHHKLSDTLAEEIEESFAEHVIPAYLDTLSRNKWLKPPNVS